VLHRVGDGAGVIADGEAHEGEFRADYFKVREQGAKSRYADGPKPPPTLRIGAR
jgi:hypothetical protein